MTLEDADLLADCAAAVLDRHQPRTWRHAVDDRWHYVLPDDHRSREQGWKLHVPATPLSACLVLSRSVEVLARHRCAFKFAVTMRRLHELVGPNADRKAAGKFVTAYPDDDDHARVVAEALHRATLGLPGQWILTDRRYRQHSQVFYRYGGFTPPTVLTDDGEYRAMLRAPDGSVVPDKRAVGQVAPSWAVDPFQDDVTPSTVAESVLVGGRFTVRSAIRQNNRGGVYLAEDADGTRLVLKRFREHTGAGVDGTDSRTRARAEARLLSILGPSGSSPGFLDIFTSGTDIFVAQQWVDGVPLRRFVARELRPRGTALALDTDLALDLTRRLVDLLGEVHAAGYVLGDLTPNNVLVTADRRLVLIDLESALRPTDVAARLLTPGYAAPEDEGRSRMIAADPDQATDLYSLGATLFYLVSGAHPPASQGTRLREMVRLMARRNPVAARLGSVVTGLLAPEPAARPSLAEVRTALAEPAPVDAAVDVAGVGELVDEMLADIVGTATPERGWLWRNSETASRYDPCSVHVGAPGVLLVLSQAARAGHAEVLDTVDLAARWTMRRLGDEPRVLPGLMFGRAGTAVSLYEAGALLGADDISAAGLSLARTLPTEWHVPDVFHGVAGAGLALVRLWRHTGDDELLVRARRCADALLAGAEEGPQWTAKGDFLLAGTTHWGFAHGVAGIATFLLDIAAATGDGRYLAMVGQAAEALAGAAILDGDAAFWPSGEDDSQADTVRLTGFCSGATGVGTFLLRLHQLTGHPAARALAEAAATAVHHGAWTAPPLWCHGLATDGDFLLDCATLSAIDPATSAASRSHGTGATHTAPTGTSARPAASSHGTDRPADRGVAHSTAPHGSALDPATRATAATSLPTQRATAPLDPASRAATATTPRRGTSADPATRYRTWAEDTAQVIAARAVRRRGRLLTPDDTGDVVASFANGYAGTLSFLLRLHHGGARPLLPSYARDSVLA
ncbi:class IV lanthionine synthetase LanL [Actinokineospora terrae]|uniref:non-specific serine/threonine protein kinase n=1 Tax=Actinokineospora terrae TaxID=155974 RepID=A0A1H9TD92_9PSEU|nr:class IV lanthionine synthetase LanL [Actinokineospora terrae]SER94779.1 Serine/threonine protein kinase [Actinokineospora terrae]